MSIFLLPKILDDIGTGGHDIYFKMSKTIPSVIVSHSLYDSLCQTKVRIEKNDIGWDSYKKITNPFEFIHSNVPGSILSVSKVKPDASIFFELIEIFQLCNLHDFIITKNKINIAHLTPNYTSTNYTSSNIKQCLNLMVLILF